MTLSDELAAVARDMLDEFGARAQLIGRAPAAARFDKVTGRPLPGSAPMVREVRAVVSPQEVLDEDGRRVTRSVATLLERPTSGDTLSMGPQLWTVGRVTTIAPQGTPIIYRAEVS